VSVRDPELTSPYSGSLTLMRTVTVVESVAPCIVSILKYLMENRRGMPDKAKWSMGEYK
jgi:hypothetical protein